MNLVGAAVERAVDVARPGRVLESAHDALSHELEHGHVIAFEVQIDTEAAATVPPMACALGDFEIDARFRWQKVADRISDLAHGTLRLFLVNEIDVDLTASAKASPGASAGAAIAIHDV